MSLEQLKREVMALSDREQAELIRYTVQLRNANDLKYRREMTERLNDKDMSPWITPDEFERRLGSAWGNADCKVDGVAN
jgi:hypothetical protein